MTIDALSLAALRAEAAERIQGCRIQKIIPTGALSFVLEVYNPERRLRVQFLMSADAQYARFHLIDQKATQQPGEPTPFLLLLRKYIRFGIVTNIEQLPFERIILITIAKKFPIGKKPHFGVVGYVPKAEHNEPADSDSEDDEPELSEDFEIYESKLVCEMMGRHSNVMLLSDENVIIDAIKRVAPSKNRYRLILPHQTYVAPPPQEKRGFHLESPDSFSRLMADFAQKQPETTLWQLLLTTFSGVSPQLSRELAYRMAEAKGLIGTGQAEVKLKDFQRWENLYSVMRELLKPLNPNETELEHFKGWIVRDEDDERIVAFAPYELHQFRPKNLASEQVNTISKAAEEYYSQTESIGGQSQRKAQLAAVVGVHQDKLKKKASSLESSLKKAESADELKRKGETIYSHLWEIQIGQTSLVADGLTIKLDPDRKPSENAQDYFREYEKARQALAGVPELLEETNYELSYIDEMLTALDLADTFEEIVGIRAELADNGYSEHTHEKADAKPKKVPRPRKRKLPQTPTYVSPDGFTIYVGKSAQHNDFVTFELGEKTDVWMHARGVPGSHVIIKTNSKEVPIPTLEMAASLAAYYSKNRTSTKVEVIYAAQRYVRKVKGPHPGLVTYSQEFGSINAKPQPFSKGRTNSASKVVAVVQGGK